ncbi:HotDog domain-containing protein [Stachybotrys elegans]|uniref:HotDog domain-containing protein n=1 Tax=Stachybotrys elegans TaxID=80388 RepID=A0A8K0T4K3_9HYPO|nr:HotDog domain-containing protein [Stachybotrys elegans]
MATAILPRRCFTVPRRLWLRGLSTSAPRPSPPRVHDMPSRPAKLIYDYLTPTHSHLLDVTLADLLPSLHTSSSPAVSSPPAALPQGHHLVYFPIQEAPSRLVPDGADPDHSPGAPYERRMWAGGEVVFRRGAAAAAALRLDGRACLCKERIAEVDVRGAEGDERVFVHVKRSYGLGHEDRDESEGEGWLIEERRTLVFMRNSGLEEISGTPRLIKSPSNATFSVSLTPSAIHLFHFSALTFNAHAIHLDRRYAQQTDGHRSLLVHGPLTLALMLRVLGAHVGGGQEGAGAFISRFSYRNLAPLYVDEAMRICLRGPRESPGSNGQTWDVWIEGEKGGLAVKGSAVVEDVSKV